MFHDIPRIIAFLYETSDRLKIIVCKNDEPLHRYSRVQTVLRQVILRIGHIPTHSFIV